MKLYATTTSERGKPVSKAGNDYIIITVTDENREHLATLRLDIKKDSLGELVTCQLWKHERVY